MGIGLEDAPVRHLWKDYIRTKRIASRNALIVYYIDLANQVAKSMRRTMPVRVTDDELQSYSYAGLIKAVQMYRIKKGIPFKKWGQQKIRYFIIDTLRSEGLDTRRNKKHGVLTLCQGEHTFLIDQPYIDQDTVEYEEKAKLLHEAVNKLPLRQLLIIKYRHFGNASNESISTMLGICTSTVVREAQEGYVNLKKLLEEQSCDNNYGTAKK